MPEVVQRLWRPLDCRLSPGNGFGPSLSNGSIHREVLGAIIHKAECFVVYTSVFDTKPAIKQPLREIASFFVLVSPAGLALLFLDCSSSPGHWRLPRRFDRAMSSLLQQNLLVPANNLDNNIEFKAEESKMLLFEQGLDLRVPA